MNSTLADLNAAIAPHLAAADELFGRELQSQLPCVNTLIRHVSRFRGKMLRPSLVLLCGQACGKLTPAHITLAAVVEMVHMATLVHDDVLDEAELRRKGATINHLKGNEAAVLLGDCLISHSYHLCSSLDSQFASRAIARTTNQVCEGELLQIDNRNNLELDEQTYLKIITLKTAVLCASCCMLGAKLSEADDHRVEQMETFGRCLGVAFQIQDDILDLIGDVAQVGKSLGSDVEKGKLTLPMILFLRTAPAEHRELLRSLLSGRDPDKAEKIRNLILPSHSLAYARKQAAAQIKEAIAALDGLEDSPAKSALETMARFVIDRPM
jgi:octaprenyl-diphosphate synthase